MSNEKTILPNSVLVSLYKDTLVLPELAQKKPEIIPNPLVSPIAQTSSNKVAAVTTSMDLPAAIVDKQATTIAAPSASVHVQIEADKDNNNNATNEPIKALGQIKYLGEHLKQVTIIVKDCER
jgi:hypothetical protein